MWVELSYTTPGLGMGVEQMCDTFNDHNLANQICIVCMCYHDD